MPQGFVSFAEVKRAVTMEAVLVRYGLKEILVPKGLNHAPFQLQKGTNVSLNLSHLLLAIRLVSDQLFEPVQDGIKIFFSLIEGLQKLFVARQNEASKAVLHIAHLIHYCLCLELDGIVAVHFPLHEEELLERAEVQQHHTDDRN